MRLWRQYDSIKAAVLLVLSAVLLIGYCIRSAARYAAFLQKRPEYLCAVPDDSILRQLAGAEGVAAYSRQKTAYLSDGQQGCTVTQLSAAYLADCYGLPGDAHTVWMNAAAFAAFCGEDAQSPCAFRGTLDGQPFTAQIAVTEKLPQGEAMAVSAVGEAALRDADTLRICADDRDAFSPGQLGLTVLNTEALLAAEYEQTLILLRIRFGALSAFLALLGAAAFLRIYRDAVLHHR